MADMTPSRPLMFLLTCFLVALLMPSAGLAQGTMDFGVEDVEEEDGEGQEGGDTGDDGEMTFGADEVQEDPQDTGAADTYTVAVVALPSDAIDRSQRIELQQKMLDAVSLDPNYSAQDGASVLNGLEENGMSCVTEPLCLSSVGQEAGVDRILIGRVEDKARGLSLNIDLFDVSDKLFVKYTSVDRLANFDSVIDSVEPGMKDIFDIRVERKGPNYGEETDTGTVQKVLAWTAAGLSVASLGTGIYFGSEASSGEEEILGMKDGNGQFTINQRQAQQMVRDVEGDALTANVLYGASAGLAVISGILFYVEGGSDVADPGDRRRRAGLLDRVDVQPTFGLGNVGLGATFSF